MKKQGRLSGSAGLIATATILGLFGAGIGSACNSNPVQFLSGDGQLSKSRPTPIGGQIPMDILWVIDNSFSMCQEQKVLRDNFNEFIKGIQQTNLDFHIAVTTTHAPESGFTIEPIAQEGRLQSTPQPVPGNNSSCLKDANGYSPFREALDIAKACLAAPETASSYDWTDTQIECALRSPRAQMTDNCVATTGLTDRNADMVVDTFDLFPGYDEYRDIPKVLKASAYRDASGQLNAERLRQDFACMSTVGTRGDGFEKGLRAAIKAVSREMTGGALGVMTSDVSRPNHGFIRQDAGFALVFVTDENDCSHDGTVKELQNPCGNNICEYLNSPDIADSPLVAPEVLAEQLRESLAATKGIKSEDITEESLLMASIHGTWNPAKRAKGPLPACTDEASKPPVASTCISPTGEAFSGDRYERFIRQFRNHYPNTVTTRDPDARLDFTQQEPLGWICSESFAPALQAIGEFIIGANPSCIKDDVFVCESSSECPTKLFTNTPGECKPFPGKMEQSYCDSGLILQLERNPAVEAEYPNITANPYCIPESVNKLAPNTCVIQPAKYQLVPCSGDSGIQYQWLDPAAVVANQLSGYTLKVTYNVSVLDE